MIIVGREGERMEEEEGGDEGREEDGGATVEVDEEGRIGRGVKRGRRASGLRKSAE